MTARGQKRLALLAAVAAVGLLLAANAHLVMAAFRSQPDCVAVEGAVAPAKRVC
ncbi:hypothetical protein [Oceanibium sediminis]|uniref:hypothetical protein n=1 Tax=Oceanibium sediminis TaxID=2026339 RepID=UPI0013007F66|nr:hypothetical protein [Oceanibium sediminis]